MISGAHAIIYSQDPETDRQFLRDVIGFPHVDVGGGWLIFGLPPSELAVHPSDENSVHELFLMADDIDEFVTQMQQHAVTCSDVHEEPWGRVTKISLPGGGKLGVYQANHGRPPQS
ncbi:MAG: extradiol dioxygenase [Gammaproteobacteria bacterium]|nr:extradiol dioxygenase [Gammaproteobacteria bacterium]